jgi:methylated-DNA-[protein]-cysteine S-methyltransferase
MSPVDRLEPLAWASIESELGLFAVGGDDEVISKVLLPHELVTAPSPARRSVLVEEAAAQIEEYLAGARHQFTIPLRSQGTAFQERVWALLSEIPYGSTVSYGWVANGVGRPRGPRAVGQALGRNPLPILRPCHRVVAAGGLGGYGGGEKLKAALLELEASAPAST